MKRLIHLLTWFALLLAAPAFAGTTALTDLSNVTGTTFGAKTFAVGGATNRSLATRLGVVAEVENYGAIPSDGGNDCTAVQAAIDTGKNVHFPVGTWNLINCYLTMVTSGQELIGDDARTSVLNFSYTGSPSAASITVGNATAQIQDVAFRKLRIAAPLGQTAIFTRWVRGVGINNVTAQVDQFLKLGDDTITTAKPTYILEWDGAELSQLGSATKHLVEERNFGGQLVMNDVFAEGAHVSGVDCWNGGGNINSPDHGIITGGYWSRCDVNWNFYGERIANYYFVNHHSEGAITSALKAGSATGASVAGGFNQLLISNSLFDAAGDVISLQCDHAGDLCDRLQISNVALGGSSTVAGNGIVLGTAGGTVRQVNINGVTARLDPASAGTKDAVRIVGTSGALLSDVSVDVINARSNNGTAIRAALRVEGTGNVNVRAGSLVSGNGVNVGIDDQSAALVRGREALTAARTYYVRSDGADTNNCLADTAAGACLTPQKAWDMIALLDLRGQTVTMQIRDATFTSGIVASKVPLGGGSVIIRGNSSTPANVVISTTSASAISFPTPMTSAVTVRDLQMQTTTSGKGLDVTAANAVSVQNIIFGACAQSQINAVGRGVAVTGSSGSVTFAGNANFGINVDLGAAVVLDSRTLTITGTPAYTKFVQAARMGYASFVSATVSGSATGTRYGVSGGAIIDTNGGGASFLPGNSAGVTTSPGVYL